MIDELWTAMVTCRALAYDEEEKIAIHSMRGKEEHAFYELVLV